MYFLLTIFTPTYNRADLLCRLFKSLQLQTLKKFEWLIVDDGSTDNTKVVVEKMMKDSAFPIRYEYQENGGKHRAINRGVSIARGNWFFIVDNDDSLPRNSIELIVKWINTVEDNQHFAGVAGMKTDKNGSNIGGTICKDFVDQYPFKIDFRGDLAEVWRTSILKEYPFPDYEGEKYCAECLVWFRIGQKYKVRYFAETIYHYEYQLDGLSFLSVINRRLSPTYTALTNIETMNFSCPFRRRLRAAINFWRFIWFKKWDWECFDRLPIWTFLCLPLGAFFLIIDTVKLRRC